MGVAPVSPLMGWEDLVHTWQELDVPEGWRAEIIEGRIVMTPPPGYPHNLIADLVHRALVRGIPDEWAIFQTAGVGVPLRSGLFIPDLMVVPREDVPSGVGPMPAEKALLVVEITSQGNADVDRKTKLWSYAHAAVPLYLLIDRFAEGGPVVELYSGPENGAYRESRRVPFGKPIDLPEPFRLTLDTDRF
ncbi:Uma2 family endonuclease [Saccharopolyspora erythraea]|uniref:Uma2 family endonuclease n=1 Tax=Saccharopolyspora erythraea TaxID=1836 RepID=UPI001BA4918E|nr:Uma2 family endonuclease [Saccharopolyspora erythraea]QUG99865.1 Uma2 family endonuclease [Saccharopolyspora erythraea]